MDWIKFLLYTKRGFFLVTLFMAVLVTSGGFYLFNWEIQNMYQDKYTELKSISSLKIEQVLQWKRQIEKDGLGLHENDHFNKLISQWIKGDGSANKDILNYFTALNHSSEFQNMGIYSPSEKTLLALDPDSLLLLPDSAYLGERITFNDFYFSNNNTFYDLVISLDKSKTDAVLILRINPDNYLFNYIKTWPTVSKTSESLLFKKDGDDVLFLSRIKKAGPKNFKLSLSQKDLPAALAIRGVHGNIEGVDYRGHNVIAFAQKIPGTNWYFLSKIDKSEMNRPILLEIILLCASVMILYLSVFFAFHLAIKNRENEQLKKEHDLKQELDTLLSNLRGMVYRCNNDEHWTINYVSEGCKDLTGYSTDELFNNNVVSFAEIIAEDDRVMVFDVIQEAISLRSDYEIEYKIIDKNGSVKWVWEKGQGIYKGDVLQYLEGLIIDITERKDLESKLFENELLFRTIFENSTIGKCITDYKTRIRANKAFCEMLGYTETEFHKVKWEEITYADDVEKSREVIDSLLRGDISKIRYEKRYYHKNGSIVWAEVNQTIQHEQNGAYFFIISVSDITHKKIVEEELQRSNKELEQFAYIASHDLQEPLRMVSSYTQLLERRYKDVLDEKAKTYINYAVDGANRMQRLINDLLSYSRINTRGHEFKKVDMHSVVAEVIVDLQVSIRDTKALVTTGDLPCVSGDETQLHRLLLNLIGNALKYRSDEEPRISVNCMENPYEWVFCVRDNGIGIEPEYFEKIFQIFQRLHTSNKYSGTGIGLAICKRIVERHGGHIWVHSKIGEGSEFYFSLNKKRSMVIG